MLSVKEAAKRLGVAPATVRVWVWKGRFPGAKKEQTPFGDFWMIPESDVVGFKRGKAGRPLKGSEPVRKSRRKAAKKMSNSVRQPRYSIITPAVERASSAFVEAAERALAGSNLSPVEVRQQVNALLGELWDACEPITAQLSNP